MTTRKQAYEILEISESASAAAIEAAYREKERAFQSDPGSDPWDFQQVQAAYELLQQRALVPGDRTPQLPNAASLKQPTYTAKPESPPVAKHLVWQAFFRELPLQNETSIFVLVNVLDIFMTWGLLRFGGIETNPIANYVLQRWGFDGMIMLKMASIAFVALLVQKIATHDLVKARRVLILGTAIVFAVVVYSGILLSRTLR